MYLDTIVRWLHEARSIYNDTLSDGDPRTSSWPLMDSPWPTLGICLAYAYFVKVVGPHLMQHREPMNIRWLMVFYNFFMVVVSATMFGLLGAYGWFGHYNWYCQPVDYSDSPEAVLMTHLSWWFYVSKFIEFADTIFFVLRKKISHISTLHVIHHGVMPMSVWWGVKFTPGGHSTFFAFVNSLVHVFMYFYYGLAAIGPHMYKYLWWKQYMTSFQMLQFIAIFLHSFQLLLRPNCDYPRGFMWWIGFHAVMFWFLFADFYRNTYLIRNRTNEVSKSSVHSVVEKFTAVNGEINVMVNNGVNSIQNDSDFRNGYCHLNELYDHDSINYNMHLKTANHIEENGGRAVQENGSHTSNAQGSRFGRIEPFQGPRTRSRAKKTQ